MRALWQKEWMGAVRSYRILFIPLAFVLVTVAQPLAYYYLPQILKESGVPEETIGTFPLLSGGEVLASAFGQLNQVGLLVVVLAAMGSISREAEGGQAGLLFSLGVTRPRYLSAKVIVFSLLVVGSVFVAMAGTGILTTRLIEPVPLARVLGASLVYSLYMLFALMLTFAFSALAPTAWAAGGMTIGFVLVFNLLSLVPALERWMPGQSTGVAAGLINGRQAAYGFLGVDAAWIILAAAAAYFFLQKREV